MKATEQTPTFFKEFIIKRTVQSTKQKISHPMNANNQHNQTCIRHRKQPTILVVKHGLYICEDCAIFEPTYRQQHLVERGLVSQEATSISAKFFQLVRQQKSLTETGLEKMSALIRSIQQYQVKVINRINDEFMQVKSKVSEQFMRAIESLERENQGNGRALLKEMKRDASDEERIMKYHLYEMDLRDYQRKMDQRMGQMLCLFQEMKEQVENKINVRIDIITAFESLLNFKPSSTSKKEQQSVNIDDDLLDFSQFSIPQMPQLDTIPQLTRLITFSKQACPCQESIHFNAKDRIERRKTAACLEDSTCSMDSLSQSIQSQIFTVDVSHIAHHRSPSLLSERSISCVSTVTKYQESQSIQTAKQPSKKPSIEIRCTQQLATKLISISPNIKSIRFSNVSISVQQFSQVLKQKISRSFVNSLQIYNCPKLNEKILTQIKSHKCKGLKRVEIKECKEINWNEKRVKDMVKKLQSEGVKVVC